MPVQLSSKPTHYSVQVKHNGNGVFNLRVDILKGTSDKRNYNKLKNDIFSGGIWTFFPP